MKAIQFECLGWIIEGRNPSAPRESIASALLRVPGPLDLNQALKRSTELLTQRCIGRGLSTNTAVSLPWNQQKQGLTPISECLQPVAAIHGLACGITTEPDQPMRRVCEHGGR